MSVNVAEIRKLLKVDDSVQPPKGLTQDSAILRSLSKPQKDAFKSAKAVEWLSLASAFSKAETSTELLAALNDDLRLNSFISGFEHDVVDVAIAQQVGPVLKESASLAKIPNVVRWYLHVCSVLGLPAAIAAPKSRTIAEISADASVKPVPLPESVKATFRAPQAGGAPAAASGGAKPQNNKKGKNKEKKPKKAKPAPAPAAAAAEPIAEIDIRVGEIIKVWEHPNSDKLWCEEIEVGEKKPRQILSGLRHNFTAEQMRRRVLVVCNLKPAKLGGIPSSGMVLCASNDDHSEVDFLEPPEGAKIGERVTFEGLKNAPPASASRVNKKKLFPKAAAELKTTDAKVAAHNGRPMMTSAGPVTVKKQGNRPIS